MDGLQRIDPKEAEHILDAIRRENDLENLRSAFCYAIRDQDRFALPCDVMRMWSAFIAKGKTEIPSHVVNFHAIMIGIPSR
jgi:hypothetical protein